ncbi:hypothetical protein MKX50_10190 [Paenibacillus sp. FSL W8-0186]|uniref:Uncharacterized protein n=1 Tax=Paenibacillus woosongensis TaxID=307580 RepID=A0ABQ4ML44_9BACL|nr:hypothetical protein [Paenibacillus woosongensis]GIP56698.1 hypothetical protein J15TS10_05120 [Paenibacillus woosongensis]
MFIIGTLLAIIIAILVSIFIGPVGVLLLVSVIFGMVLSMYIRNREMYNDIQRIKEKLGIVEQDDFNMSNEAIEEELLEEMKHEARNKEK